MLLLEDVSIRRGAHSCHVEKLHLKPGTALGLVGPNGSGKTTFMNALVAAPGIRVCGKVEADGAVYGSYSGYLAHFFYSAGTGRDLYRRLTVRETLELVRSAWKSHFNVDNTLQLFHMEAYSNKRVEALSQGQEQILYLSLAWISDAPYVLLDEPMNALDPIRSRLACRIVLDLKRLGKGVIISSHIMSDIDALCDSVAFLVDGELRLEEVTDSRERYLQLYS